MSQRNHGGEGELSGFISGVILGLIISAPIAAWLSPRSGYETRQGIRQRGLIIRRKAGQTIRKPIQQVQGQIEHLKGDSIEEALEEGKAIAARRAANVLSEG